jgi:FMN phosphatase YigB (HAD superfamily)
LFERAARELGFDLRHSWFVGDKLQDAEPARRLGGRGVLLGIPAPADAQRTRDLGVAVAPDLQAAAALIGLPAE